MLIFLGERIRISLMTKDQLIIATRESPLALWQANWVKAQLETLYPGLAVSLLGITTKADKMLEISLATIGGKGLFVKELEEALYAGRADIAVHSMKDVPMELPAGLCLPVMCEREEPGDVFVSNEFESLSELPVNATIGTSSLRRQSQLYAMRSDWQVVPLRGNVNTRLQKLDKGDFTAIILAAAGLKRLGFEERIRSYISFDQMLPAAGQGVLGIECRMDDVETLELIAPLRDPLTEACVTAERAMCNRLGGGCQAPVAAYAEIDLDKIMLRGLVAQPDGGLILHAHFTDVLANAEQIGQHVAEKLILDGAEEILRCLPKKS